MGCRLTLHTSYDAPAWLYKLVLPSIGGLRKWAIVSVLIDGKIRRRTTLGLSLVWTRNFSMAVCLKLDNMSSLGTYSIQTDICGTFWYTEFQKTKQMHFIVWNPIFNGINFKGKLDLLRKGLGKAWKFRQTL